MEAREMVLFRPSIYHWEQEMRLGMLLILILLILILIKGTRIPWVAILMVHWGRWILWVLEIPRRMVVEVSFQPSIPTKKTTNASLNFHGRNTIPSFSVNQ